jgi:hypothetical protein
MTTDFSRPSARIYAFRGGRRFVGAARDESPTASNPRARAISRDAIGEAWYHRQSRKRSARASAEHRHVPAASRRHDDVGGRRAHPAGQSQ